MEQKTINQFISELSSDAPVPGGGGASALAASMGLALGSMVANLTSGKKKYADVQEEIEALIKQTEELSKELLSYMEKDARAFEPLSRAYGLPRSTEEEQKKRDEIMEECLLVASRVPLELMEKIAEGLKLLERLGEIGTRIAISDVGVGAQMAKAALSGASLNVFINTRLMKERQKAEELNQRAMELIRQGNEMADKIFEQVLSAVTAH